MARSRRRSCRHKSQAGRKSHVESHVESRAGNSGANHVVNRVASPGVNLPSTEYPAPAINP